MIHSFTNVSANITFSLCEIYIEKEKLSDYCLFRSQQFVTVCVKMFLPANERELYLCFLKRDKVTNDFIKKTPKKKKQLVSYTEIITQSKILSKPSCSSTMKCGPVYFGSILKGGHTDH